MKRKEIAKPSLYYTDSGKGSVIVLLHGFLENLSMWDSLRKSLASKYRIICIDLPGHGRSPQLDEVHSMPLMAAGVKQVLDFLHLRKYIILGHSMGGYVALDLAAKYPDHIKGLLLFYSTALADSIEKKASRLQAAELAEQNHRSFIRISLPLLFRPKSRRMYQSEISKLKREAVLMTKEGVKAALLGMRVRKDYLELLENAHFPIGFISGAHDPVISLESLKLQHQAKAVQFVEITDNGHMGHIEDRAICMNKISEFASTVF